MSKMGIWCIGLYLYKEFDVSSGFLLSVCFAISLCCGIFDLFSLVVFFFIECPRPGKGSNLGVL